MNSFYYSSTLHVAHLSICNVQQESVLEDAKATLHAIVAQQVSWKSLSTQALMRNKACNKDATLPFSRVQQKLFREYVFVAPKERPFINKKGEELQYSARCWFTDRLSTTILTNTMKKGI